MEVYWNRLSSNGKYARTIVTLALCVTVTVFLKNDSRHSHLSDIDSQDYIAKETSSNLTEVFGEITSNSTEIVTVSQRPFPPCPEKSSLLLGNITPDLTVKPEIEIMRANPGVKFGGSYTPPYCTARHRVAVVVPCRDRKEHLQIFLANLHPILQRQQLAYTIFVVEQWGNDTFNKGRLLNAAFIEVNKTGDFGCFVFHDVDTWPVNDNNPYSCPKSPMLLTTQRKHFTTDRQQELCFSHYETMYADFFGAAVAIPTEQFAAINGYPTMYWGWGGEDDDMGDRVKQKFGNILRAPSNTSVYWTLRHGRDKGNPENPNRVNMRLTAKTRFKTDVLANFNYTLVSRQYRSLYTWLLVDVGKPPLKDVNKSG